jgi:uncharacterized iron-regulated membrane protein
MMTPRALRAWYAVHKWTSLVATAFLLLLCVTGLPLVFYHELDHALGNSIEAPERPPDAPRASLDPIVAAARAERPSDVVQFVSRDPDESAVWFVTLAETANAEDATALLLFDAHVGTKLHDYPLRSGILYVFWKLHVDLFAGLPGSLFVGFIGVLFAASLISGAVVYGPFMRRLPFGEVRHDRAARTKWLDWHNLLGIVTLGWALVVGVTGIINALAHPILGYWQSTELAAMTAPYRDRPPLTELGSVERAAQAALAAEPDMGIQFIAFPGNEFAGNHHYAVFLHGNTPLTSRLLKPVLVDATTGEVSDSRSLPWYATALLVSQPLHFGDYGGMPMKILWALLDLVTIAVLGSGLYLWLKRGSEPLERRLAELERSLVAGGAR